MKLRTSFVKRERTMSCVLGPYMLSYTGDIKLRVASGVVQRGEEASS